MNPERSALANTKLFKNGNSQAVRIPSKLAYSSWDIEMVIKRHGDELRIRSARRRMGDVLSTFAQFSPDFMREGRGLSIEGVNTLTLCWSCFFTWDWGATEY